MQTRFRVQDFIEARLIFADKHCPPFKCRRFYPHATIRLSLSFPSLQPKNPGALLLFFMYSLKLGAPRPFQLAPAPCCQRLPRTRPWLPIRGRKMSDWEMSDQKMSGQEMSGWEMSNRRMSCFGTKHDTIKRREMKHRFLYALGGRGWQLWTC